MTDSEWFHMYQTDKAIEVVDTAKFGKFKLNHAKLEWLFVLLTDTEKQ